MYFNMFKKTREHRYRVPFKNRNNIATSLNPMPTYKEGDNVAYLETCRNINIIFINELKYIIMHSINNKKDQIRYITIKGSRDTGVFFNELELTITIDRFMDNSINRIWFDIYNLEKIDKELQSCDCIEDYDSCECSERKMVEIRDDLYYCDDYRIESEIYKVDDIDNFIKVIHDTMGEDLYKLDLDDISKH